MTPENYHKQLEKIISELDLSAPPPRLLLHSCCAPCSSYCIEFLSQYFSVTVLYFNPNIEPEEYERRLAEQKRFIKEFPTKYPVSLIEGRYNTQEFYSKINGLENEREGGNRCSECFDLRLHETAKIASEQGFDYFCTTLSISPHKNAAVLNNIGKIKAEKYSVRFLPSDFKKNNGYKRSLELSREYNLYRQNYCGCEYSKR